ncbi:MAG: hypothetical protein GXY86_07585 [Firmicutes bacterium]|nr:hypothetical protein [Bacillota bacterium]
MLATEADLNVSVPENDSIAQTIIDEEEFFERTLFQDVLEMKSVRMLSEATGGEFGKLQDQVYRKLFNLYQEVRGVTVIEENETDEVFAVFELFFKNYYQRFRKAMEELIAASKSPVKIAYVLGQKADKIMAVLDSVAKEIESELN